jgi:hypothetical protein
MSFDFVREVRLVQLTASRFFGSASSPGAVYDTEQIYANPPRRG